jgi:hypothetical protein
MHSQMTSSSRGLDRLFGSWRYSVPAGVVALACFSAPSILHREPSTLKVARAALETQSVTEPAIPAAPTVTEAQVGGPEVAGEAAAEAPPPLADAASGLPSPAPTREPEMDEVNQYLWGVYQRTEMKRDGSGDFTWKDVAAAARVGMSLGDYVIRGMDRDFREVLYRAGHAMDAAGIHWAILSAFRDDYRQFLATGYKARNGDSLHGGSATTGGYGHGCAVDIKLVEGDSHGFWSWIDANSLQIGLQRPLPGIDPAHVQPRGPWHEVAAAWRDERLGRVPPPEDGAAPAVDLNGTPSDGDMLCIGLHHHRTDPIQAVMPMPVEVHNVETAERPHAAASKSASAGEKAKAGGHARGSESKTAKGESIAEAGKPHGKSNGKSAAHHSPAATPHTAGTT